MKATFDLSEWMNALKSNPMSIDPVDRKVHILQ